MDEAVRDQTTDRIAEQILRNARTFLFTKLPFMCLPVNQLRYVPSQGIDSAMMTDGASLFYSPERIVSFFLIGHTPLIARMILHSVLHCLFRHHRFLKKDLIWHTACDVTVESVIDSLCIKEFTPKRTAQIDHLFSGKMDMLTSAPAVDRILRSSFDPADESDAKTLRKIGVCYYADDHQLWGTPARTSVKKAARTGRTDQDPEPEGAFGDTGQEEINWEQISRQTMLFMKRCEGIFPGSRTQGLVESVGAVNRVQYDFRKVLRRFASLSEVPEIDQEEFDLAWYTLGMDMYGDMPLVEPMESKENRRLKDFVIVIDTSGSTSGDLVRRFVDLTYTILKSEELFSNQINVHIIQCDMEIQEHVKLTCRQDFEDYIGHLKVKGLGGTSFVPAFEYVETLRGRGELTDLKGLIYFTDGYGTFPEQPTDYETIFAYYADDQMYNNLLVPSWITKLILTKDDLQEVE